MKEQLVKAMKRNQIVNMMYMSNNGEITKRRVKLVKITGDSFQAYCFTRLAKRIFTINNVLAVVLIMHKERSVV
ncbi:transcriptional regulator (plasmid) [Lysinibacillus sphaericus]|uniref:transcriptional regulator n=1 Tax=Lysinibacillus sphaericus TaxID=1421 RepID=UPI001E5C8C87|nr:transcriptional regulator [Lysinibacillus sphaericus]UDK94826.1 transcriptional regulator [Lysinibacillus sphaericus]UDK94918.1 transcriptional regulator [Lysinibacillus sphaericus]